MNCNCGKSATAVYIYFHWFDLPMTAEDRERKWIDENRAVECLCDGCDKLKYIRKAMA